MGEKTTIEIEKMRELKQHALDTNKTLKQIINEAIDEKIIREREELNLPAYPDLQSENSATIKADNVPRELDAEPGDISDFDPQILNIVRSECARSGLRWDDLTKDQWNEKLEFSIQMALEMVYDESVALDTIKQIKTKLSSN